MKIRTVRKIGGSYICTIPPAYATHLGIVSGDYLSYKLVGAGLLVKKVDLNVMGADKPSQQEVVSSGGEG